METQGKREETKTLGGQQREGWKSGCLERFGDSVFSAEAVLIFGSEYASTWHNEESVRQPLTEHVVVMLEGRRQDLEPFGDCGISIACFQDGQQLWKVQMQDPVAG